MYTKMGSYRRAGLSSTAVSDHAGTAGAASFCRVVCRRGTHMFKSFPAGNRTRVTRVTGGYTNHYTIADLAYGPS